MEYCDLGSLDCAISDGRFADLVSALLNASFNTMSAGRLALSLQPTQRNELHHLWQREGPAGAAILSGLSLVAAKSSWP